MMLSSFVDLQVRHDIHFLKSSLIKYILYIFKFVVFLNNICLYSLNSKKNSRNTSVGCNIHKLF